MAIRKLTFGVARGERLPAALLVAVFVALCFAGGASREDALGQAAIRLVVTGAMIIQMSVGKLPDFRRYKMCFWLLVASIALAAVQLVPLPPSWWTALPGRSAFLFGPLGRPWRPINLVPDAGWNALFSLLVPLGVLTLVASLGETTMRKTPFLLLGAAAFSVLFAVLRAAGPAPDTPLLSGQPSDYGGIFANRNHQAVFLGIGIVTALYLALIRFATWRDGRFWLAAGAVLVFAIAILATGSRSGAILGGVAILVTPLLANFTNRWRPGGWRPSTALSLIVPVVLVAGALSLTLFFGRAQSIDRASALSLADDFRLRALPTVLQTAWRYFPIGSGLGSFDAVFRMAEPKALLEPTYFNHAHDDFLEVLIETGIAGCAILVVGLGWLAWRFVATFRDRDRDRDRDGDRRLGRIGALIIVLICIASVSDYPSRTPMVMATLVLAACWLTDSSGRRVVPGRSSALPSPNPHL